MAISFVAASSVIGGTSTASPAWPAGVQDGDVVLLFVETANEAPTVIGGFNILVDPATGDAANFGTGTAGGTTSTRIICYWRRYTTGDVAVPSGSISNLGNHATAVMVAYRGVEDVALCIETLIGDVDAADSTSVTFPSLTTSNNGCWIVNAVAWATDTTAAQASGWTNANLSGLTERVDGGNGSGNGGGLSIADGELITAGSSGSTTATLANSSVQARLTLALIPDGVRAPVTQFTVAVSSGATTSNTATHNVALPGSGVDAGDVIVIAFTCDSAPTITWDNSAAGTWTQRYAQAFTDARLEVRSKTCAGTEDGATLAITTSATEQATWFVFHIKGAHGDIEVGTGNTSSSNTNGLRPSDTPLEPTWGKAQTLFLGIVGHDGAPALGFLAPANSAASAVGITGSSSGSVAYGYAQLDAAAWVWGGVCYTSNESFAAVQLAIRPGASSGYTLTADGGSVSETGQTASLLFGPRLDAAGGSFSETGQDVTLRKGRPLTSESGGFTLSGQVVSFTRAYVLAATSGAFNLAGQDAGVLCGRRSAGDPGAFSYAGQDATFARGFGLVAEAGGFSLNGQDTTLTYGANTNYTLTASAGAVAHGGQAAGLFKGFKLPTQQIHYTLSGQSFAHVPRQDFPGAAPDWLTIDGKYAYQGNRNTVDYPPEVDWPLKVSDRGNIHRFEVRKGERGWSGDNANAVNRSEIVFWDTTLFDTDYIVSFAFLIENLERTQASAFHTLFQFHHEPDVGDTVTVPPFSMTYAASDGNINFHHRTSNDDPLTATPAFTFLGFAPATPGQWMHVYMEARWAPSGGGYYRIWVNGVQKVSHSGATGYNDADAPRPQYGTYRSAADQTFAVQFANMEWSAGSALAGRRMNPLRIDDADLGFGRRLAAEGGTGDLAGQAASLAAVRTLPLAFGQFALAGQDLSFRFNRVFRPDTAAVVVQGQDAILDKAEPVHWLLPAAAAVLLISGQATLRGPPWTPVGAGAGSWTAAPESPGAWAPIPINPETWTPQ